MSAIANLVAFDGAATPVSHTLVPISVSREGTDVLAEWREMLASVPSYAQVRASTRSQRLKSGVYKQTLTVVVPVMETVTNQNAAGYTAAPKVAYENTFQIVGYFHERSDITGRRLARQLAANILDGNTATRAATTTGPAPELYDQLVSPT